ncbi:Putative tRNA (cytidine(34)-2'-O)-methyltransferase [Galdieria sulphuraria]|nr:Putative tRNA (cytidine(34)-2'-O)-methyltransferase [Galdieria sulphuraria]
MYKKLAPWKKRRRLLWKPLPEVEANSCEYGLIVPTVGCDLSLQQEEIRLYEEKWVIQKDSINVVLFQPKIPGNTGNIGRTCLAFGAKLHLIGPLGFSIDEHAVRRAGLDYWKYVDWKYSSCWEDFEKGVPENSHIYFITTQGTVSLERVTFKTTGPVFLIFGSETEGFQQLPIKALDKGTSVYIPMQNKHIVRSHNLSNAVAIALWELHKLE